MAKVGISSKHTQIWHADGNTNLHMNYFYPEVEYSSGDSVMTTYENKSITFENTFGNDSLISVEKVIKNPISFAYRISEYNRNRKWNIFLKEIAPTIRTSILDVGYSDHEYSDTDNYIEKHYPHLERLTALGIEKPLEFKERYPAVNAVHYDGDHFPFDDKSFDVCWSNAVVEHVGSRNKQLLFLKEVKRVAKRAFITTPNRLFPIEVHTRTPLLHFLPKSIFERYLHMIGKSWACGDYMTLLSKSDLEALLAESGITNYRLYKNKLFGITLDFVVVIES